MNPIASTPSSPSSVASAAVTRAPVSPVPEVRPVQAVTDNLRTSNSGNNRAKTEASASKLKASEEDIQRATEDLKQRVQTLAPELQFSVDQTSGRSIIKFTDRATKEVIRQFPSEEALALTRAMDQFQRGLIFNRQA
ncbi:flagellar protein FlaG [Rhodoferax sp. U11-2br]|uniref:flagellar protein FlaG n=1 Tax=Rhodoferax sp. U11-2br TaxID=2838878 RepID=UPI001BE942C1|nr:flagellar protein FlaG [Rhodoferax sp. U11-2br]MBT3066980.1 flagellar protein FlaG [Rhodoferax sp. U11-2br]